MDRKLEDIFLCVDNARLVAGYNNKRLLSLLKSLKTELEVSKSFPHAVLKDIDSLIKKVEDAV